MTIFKILLARAKPSNRANPITIEVEAETIEQAERRLGDVLSALVRSEPLAVAVPCHPGAACSKPEPADPKPDPHAGCKRELQRVKEARNTDLRRERDALLASFDAIVLARQKADILNAEACKAVDCASADLIPAIQRLRATVGSLRETTDRLRADLEFNESLARSRFAEMERLATELEAERAKVEELRSALDTGRDRALEAALDVWRKRALEAEANLADERVKAQIARDTGPALTKPMTAERYDHGARTSSVVLRSLDSSERIVVEYIDRITREKETTERALIATTAERDKAIADARRLSAFGETLHRVRAVLEGAGEPAAPGRSAPIGDVRVDE